MNNDTNCKGCSASVRHSFEEVKANMSDYINTIDEDLRTSEDIYMQRLHICSSCPGLYYETTCKYCGCFVQMRALKKNMNCPDPSGSKW